MKNFKRLSLFAIALLTLSSCKQDEKEKEQIPTSCEGVKWTYQGDNGQKNWDILCTGYAACAGKKQSPINITGAVPNPELKPLILSYEPSKAKVKNTGHGIKFDLSSSTNKASIQGEKYKLLQFHYHGKSEHTINGKYAGLEVHFVHQNINDENKFAVIGIMINEGEADPLLTAYLDKFPTTEGGSFESDKIEIESLFPKGLSYYNYSGSLTTPPCGEVVNWHVLKSEKTASAEQIKKFTELLGSNYREVQDLNGRSIYEFNENSL